MNKIVIALPIVSLLFACAPTHVSPTTAMLPPAESAPLAGGGAPAIDRPQIAGAQEDLLCLGLRFSAARSDAADLDELPSGNVALAMGNVHLEAANGDKVTVDKTFGYRRDADGALKIVLHHSSLPYAPPK